MCNCAYTIYHIYVFALKYMYFPLFVSCKFDNFAAVIETKTLISWQK